MVLLRYKVVDKVGSSVVAIGVQSERGESAGSGVFFAPDGFFLSKCVHMHTQTHAQTHAHDAAPRTCLEIPNLCAHMKAHNTYDRTYTHTQMPPPHTTTPHTTPQRARGWKRRICADHSYGRKTDAGFRYVCMLLEPCEEEYDLQKRHASVGLRKFFWILYLCCFLVSLCHVTQVSFPQRSKWETVLHQHQEL